MRLGDHLVTIRVLKHQWGPTWWPPGPFSPGLFSRLASRCLAKGNRIWKYPHSPHQGDHLDSDVFVYPFALPTTTLPRPVSGLARVPARLRGAWIRGLCANALHTPGSAHCAHVGVAWKFQRFWVLFPDKFLREGLSPKLSELMCLQARQSGVWRRRESPPPAY